MKELNLNDIQFDLFGKLVADVFTAAHINDNNEEDLASFCQCLISEAVENFGQYITPQSRITIDTRDFKTNESLEYTVIRNKFKDTNDEPNTYQLAVSYPDVLTVTITIETH